MKVYIATPVTSRPEPTLGERLKKAMYRVSYIGNQLIGCYDNRLIQCDVVSTFDVNPSVPAETTEDEALVRCFELIKSCDGIIIDDRIEKELGIKSIGMLKEKEFAERNNKVIFYTSKLWY